MVEEFEQILSAITIFFITLGMGASLTLHDFVRALKQPQGLAIGVSCQYGIMPLIGFALITIFDLPDAVAIGVLILACMPGGTTSNMFTYFARGNLALSVLMTATSTVCGVVLVPLLLAFYAGALQLKVPSENIVIALTLILAPVAIGVLIRRANERIAAITERVGSIIGVVFIIFLIAAWVPRNWNFLMETQTGVYVAAITLGVGGILLGYGIALLLGLNQIDARTVGIETGLQNGPLAFSIIAFTFTGPDQQLYMAAPALYSFLILFVASLATLIFRATHKPHTTVG